MKIASVMKLSFDLRKRIGDLDLAIAGELKAPITGLFGPSGCGKTTLLHMLAGLEQPDAGQIVLGHRMLYGADIKTVPPHLRNMGMVFQESRLFPHLNVLGNLTYGMRYKSQEGAPFGIKEVVTWLDLAELLEKPARALSGGEAQRVALGRALLRRPQFLLLDEPLASLDRGQKMRILPLLRRIYGQTGIPMLYVSHDLGELLQLTRDLMIMSGGKLIGQGAFLDLVQDELVLDSLHDLGLLNVMPMIILEVDQNEGLTYMVPEGCEGADAWIGPGLEDDTMRLCHVALRPEDIALTKEVPRQISIQNRCRAKVLNLVMHQRRCICVLDVGGYRLLAEVTPHAIHELHLNVGDQVTCLFKAQALRYLD